MPIVMSMVTKNKNTKLVINILSLIIHINNLWTCDIWSLQIVYKIQQLIFLPFVSVFDLCSQPALFLVSLHVFHVMCITLQNDTVLLFHAYINSFPAVNNLLPMVLALFRSLMIHWMSLILRLVSTKVTTDLGPRLLDTHHPSILSLYIHWLWVI